MDSVVALREYGMLLQSAHGPIPTLAELVAGESISGSWWGHPASRAIYEAISAAASSPDVVRVRLIRGKVTLVHRRLWPALVRVADRFSAAALAAIREEHTPSGAHRVTETPFPDWVPEESLRAATRLTEQDALDQLPLCLR
jgi:hypothetical protein